MKIAIVHLSDFHIHAGDQFLSQKTEGILSALNVLGKVDDYIVVFSGDLSHSGQVNEFKQSRYLLGKIISGIKQKNDNKFVNLFMVPGNHDLCLPENARVRKDIQEHYDSETIEELIPNEISYLENYYSYSNANGRIPGEHVNVRDVINVGIKAKILRETENLSVYFLNKNHLSYFIAKYLIRLSQGEPADTSGIEYALENICFGINSDIVLFISYILNNTRILTSISNYAGELLKPWDALSLSDKNISLLHNIPLEQINPPSDEERKKYEKVKEESEETHYSEDIIEAKGLFDYDDTNIDQYQYRLVRALKYTEMICKALPAFHSKLKLNQKNDLVDSIYLYPRKIVFALLRPLDMNLKEICKDILDFAERNNKKKKDGSSYTNDDVLEMLNDSARAIMLSMFDHFSELATSPKSFDLLMEKSTDDISECLERLLMIESTGNTDRLVKEAETMLKEHQRTEYDTMIRLIVRKHLLTNKEITYSKKQQVIDKIFGKGYRKYFLINKE